MASLNIQIDNKKYSVKTIALITRYRFRLWNYGFLGVFIMCLAVMIMITIESWLIGIFIAMIGWGLCEWLIEKEVNNWLNKKAILEIKNG